MHAASTRLRLRRLPALPFTNVYCGQFAHSTSANLSFLIYTPAIQSRHKGQTKVTWKTTKCYKKKNLCMGGYRHPLPNMMTFSSTRRERSFVSHFWTGFVRGVPVCLPWVWSAGPRWRMGASGPLPGSVSPGDGPLLERDPQI